MNYLAFASLSAVFAALTSVLAKIGMQKVNSNVATALRCIVIVIFSWLMAFITTDVAYSMAHLSSRAMLFLVLSGVTTGLSWMCYFHALKTGNINVVVPIDKSSIVFTIILSSLIFKGEKLTPLKVILTAVIALGTFLMIEKKHVSTAKSKRSSVIYAFMGAVFAALTSILGKFGTQDIPSDLASAIRTCVVLLMAWIIVFLSQEYKQLNTVGIKSMFFIILSGVSTGCSWLCYYRALSMGPASIVAPIDKLSIVLTVFLGCIFFKEKLSLKSLAGLVLISSGTLLLLIC